MINKATPDRKLKMKRWEKFTNSTRHKINILRYINIIRLPIVNHLNRLLSIFISYGNVYIFFFFNLLSNFPFSLVQTSFTFFKIKNNLLLHVLNFHEKNTSFINPIKYIIINKINFHGQKLKWNRPFNNSIMKYVRNFHVICEFLSWYVLFTLLIHLTTLVCLRFEADCKLMVFWLAFVGLLTREIFWLVDCFIRKKIAASYQPGTRPTL